MTSTFVSVELVHVTTSCCHITIGLPKRLYDDCRNKKACFHCPKCGGKQVFKTSELDQLKQDVQRLTIKLDEAKILQNQAERQRDASKKSHRKIRDRVKNGVCPCCNRSFQNLLRHMRTEHPDFGTNKTLRQLREAYGMTQGDLARELGVTQMHVSCYECDRSVATWAKIRIDAWIKEQGDA